MTDHEPIEPSAIVAVDGTRVPTRPGPASPFTGSGSLLPTLVRAATSSPLRTASVLALTAAAALKAAEVAGRLASRGPSMAVGSSPGQHAGVRALEVSWTHIEIRWPV